MRLLLPILLLFCVTSTIQAFSFEELGDSILGVVKSAGKFISTIPDQYKEWKRDNGERKCHLYLEDIKLLLATDSTFFWYEFYDCDKVLKDAEVGIRTFWGRLGYFVRAMADLAFDVD
ncbi:unnamed protein product [Caenorhabditis brenneri]